MIKDWVLELRIVRFQLWETCINGDWENLENQFRKVCLSP